MIRHAVLLLAAFAFWSVPLFASPFAVRPNIRAGVPTGVSPVVLAAPALPALLNLPLPSGASPSLRIFSPPPSADAIAPLTAIQETPKAAQATPPSASVGLHALTGRLRDAANGRKAPPRKIAAALGTYFDRSEKRAHSSEISAVDAAYLNPNPVPSHLRRPKETVRKTAASVPPVESRWARMKSSTKSDFKSLGASLATLRKSLKLPISWNALKTDGRAAVQFAEEVKRLGWKAIAAVVAYYLVRDSILYLLIPALLYAYR